MGPAAGYAFFGGARGPRPTGRYVEPRVGDGVLQWSAAEQMPLGYDVPSARQRRAGRRIPTPVYALARNDRETGRRGDVGIAPYEIAGGRAGRDGERWGKMFTLAALTLGNYYCIIN